LEKKNLISVDGASKSFDLKVLLNEVSIGVSEESRIGIVGRNGDGKSTLIKILAGSIPPDSGKVSRSKKIILGMLNQFDLIDPKTKVSEYVLGGREEHEWAGNFQTREIFNGLFGIDAKEIFDRKFVSLSGGEKRRVCLAKLLIEPLNLILLDEPTNHLDVEGVAWLATHLRKRKNLAAVVITHDRWFLDEISESMWEVINGSVEEYDGGYSAYVLAKAERSRQSAVENSKRDNLIRKELAWLRRGAPARTTKPKFRVDAANELISNEPDPRNKSELLNFASNRLGNTVYEVHNGKLDVGDKNLIKKLDWNIGPGERIALVGVNGAGKTTLMRTLHGDHKFSAGKLVRGITVKAAFLSQHLEELDPTFRVLEAVEMIANRVELGDGREMSASQLCERLGFDYAGQQTMVRDLSGGEKRRLQLTRLLMGSPNVLLLDEPTNDFDVETLTSLEDLLDSFAGTLVVISHDRYFLERTCDKFVGLLGNGALRDLPRGIDEYLELRQAIASDKVLIQKLKSSSSLAEIQKMKKNIAKYEKQIQKLSQEELELNSKIEEASFDHEVLVELTMKIDKVREIRFSIEEEWMNTIAELEK
jgi:ATP-binding cassette subfamily F protein uup